MTQSSTPLTLNTLAVMLQALGVNLSVTPTAAKNQTVPVPGPLPVEQREMPKDIDARTLKALVDALAQVDYDLRDEAAPFIAALEAQEADAAAERNLVLQLIEEDQANLAAQADDDLAAALALASLGSPADADTASDTNVDTNKAGPSDEPPRTVWAGSINPAVPPSYSGFRCAECGVFNLLNRAKDSWYVVTRGKSVGVMKDWLVVSPLVNKVPGAAFKKYDSHEAAIKAWEYAKANGLVENL